MITTLEEIIPIATILGFVALFTIVWNASRNNTVVNTKLKYLEDIITRLEKQRADDRDIFFKLLHRLEDRISKLSRNREDD